MTTKVALYARYSTEHQNQSSIADQLALCRRRCKENGWNIVAECYDEATSGTSRDRPGMDALRAKIASGEIDYAIAEALDRFGRDQTFLHQLHAECEFRGVELVSCTEGKLQAIHVALGGFVAAEFISMVSAKTKRGLQAVAKSGRMAGGKSYGYRAVEVGDARGHREIIAEEAEIVKRIFAEFAAGHSPLAIAHRLNKEGIPGPRGKDWGQSTINGNAKRGNGILNNEMYIGKLVWNRQTFRRDPTTKRRVSRLNPREVWEIQDVPHLQIIDDELWQQVKQRQAGVSAKSGKNRGDNMQKARRAKHLFSGLVRCGRCGGNVTVRGTGYYGCAKNKEKAKCDNGRSIKISAVEERVLSGLRGHLMAPERVEAFTKSFIAEANKLRQQEAEKFKGAEKRIAKIDREIGNVMAAIRQGIVTESTKNDLLRLEDEKHDLTAKLASKPGDTPIRFHPKMADIYRQKIDNLIDTLKQPETRVEAAEILRGLVDEVRLTPREEGTHPASTAV